MRALIMNFLVALAIIVVPGGEIACGQDIGTEHRGTVSATKAPNTSAKLLLEIGDKLKISFYETIDIRAMKPSGREQSEPQGGLRTFYQRMDLTGDYTIEQDGVISIPLLGRFQVEGRPLDDVRGDLAVSFTAVMGRSANIDVKILDRVPIYVVGPVKNPGAYKHVPGMIVLHAIALAGGLDRGEGTLSGMIEGAREMERVRSLTLQIKQLLARRSRLEAERDGASSLPMPIQLTKLAGERTARSFLATESTILRAEQARRLQQDKGIALRVVAARTEVNALKSKLDQIDVQKNMRIERLDDLQKLKDRGWVTSNNVVMLRTELSDIEARRQDYLVAVVQAEARLAEAQEASARLSSENRANLANAIATVDKDIAVAQDAMISARAFASIFYRTNSRTPSAVSYEIVRQSKDGASSLQATETSPLIPGDVLKISSDMAAINSSSPVAPMRQEATLQHIRTANGTDAAADVVIGAQPEDQPIVSVMPDRSEPN
jgi:protein involved in polysaccharide export with SLBB domain